MKAGSNPERWYEPDGANRRRWFGRGGPVPAGADAWLLEAAGGRISMWRSAGRKRAAGGDQLAAERTLWAMLDAGLVTIVERRDRRGDWAPLRWGLTEAGEERASSLLDAADTRDLEGEIGAMRRRLISAAESDRAHPALAALGQWLDGDAVGCGPTATKVVLAVGDALLDGRFARERVLSLRVAGHTKRVRIDDHRTTLEAAFDCPLEDLVRRHGQAVLVYGPMRFRVGTLELDALWSRPWLALTADTLAAMSQVRVDTDTLLTIENLTAFEEVVRCGDAEGQLVMYTGGFVGNLERRFVDLAAGAGVREVRHWGDLDPGGIAILRHLRACLPVPVRSWRMEPELLDRLPGEPLSEEDRRRLEGWLAGDPGPERELIERMLSVGRRCEQEAWFL